MIKTNQITAAEARQMSLGGLKDISYLYEGIRIMASSGKRYASYNILELSDPELIKNTLESKGFKIEIKGNNFTITW